MRGFLWHGKVLSLRGNEAVLGLLIDSISIDWYFG